MASCAPDSISPDVPAVPETTDGTSYYAVVSLNLADNNTTRANETPYDKGTVLERSVITEYNKEEITPNYLIFLNPEETHAVAVFPFEYTTSEESDDKTTYKAYTAYIRLYEEEEELKKFSDIPSSRVMAVLNDPTGFYYKLKEELETAPVSTTRIRDHKLNDFDGQTFITDAEGKRYMTMTSSMVIKDEKSVPAAKLSTFKFYPTPQKAKANPFAMYLERMHAKYTLLFKTGSKDLVGSDNNMNSPSGSFYYLSEGGVSSWPDEEVPTGSSALYPANRIVITPCGVDDDGKLVPGSDPKPLKYVNYYDRSPAIGDRYPVNVYTTTDWKVNIIGWGVNAVQQQEYFFKKIIPNAAYTSEEWFYTPDNSRCFWAEDPNYNEGVYPDQFREARFLVEKDDNGNRELIYDIDPEVKHVEFLEDLEDGVDHSKGLVEPTLKYFTFSELSKKESKNYIPEHTFYGGRFKEGDSYENKAQLRYGTHLIVAAQLLIKGTPEAPFEPSGIYDSPFFDSTDGSVVSSIFRPRSKYYMNDIFWEENAYKNYVAEYLGYWMLTENNKKIFGENDGIFYTNDEGAMAEAGDFIIEQAHIAGGDAMVWVKPADGITLYTFNPEGEDDSDTPDVDERYTAIKPDDYRSLAYEHKNYMAQCFNEGRMYYASGTPHKDTKVTSQTPTTGDYGTVRNNWYNFRVEGISAPGTPVSDFDQPIIPNNEPKETALGVSIQLMDWRIQTEDVKVEEQHRPGQTD